MTDIPLALRYHEKKIFTCIIINIADYDVSIDIVSKDKKYINKGHSKKWNRSKLWKKEDLKSEDSIL